MIDSHHLFNLLALGLVAIFLVGCSTAGRNFNMEKTKKVEKGMTKSEVRQVIGQDPNRKRQSSKGTTWIYMYGKAQSSPLSFVPIVGPMLGSTKTKTKNFHVHFNEEGKVTRWKRFGR